MHGKRRWMYGFVAGAVLLGGCAWWWFHDSLRGIGQYAISDQTTYYQAAHGLFEEQRRSRRVSFKGITIRQIHDAVKDEYPERDGWKWNRTGMPNSFTALRMVKGDRAPEILAGALTADGSLQLVEFRVMSASEIQMISRVQGSNSFVSYPEAPRPRRSGNPRFAIAP